MNELFLEALQGRLAKVGSQERYLDFLTQAMEEEGETVAALKMADELYEQMPYNKPNDDERQMLESVTEGEREASRLGEKEAYVRTELPKALTAVTGKMTTPDTIQKILDHKE